MHFKNEQNEPGQDMKYYSHLSINAYIYKVSLLQLTHEVVDLVGDEPAEMYFVWDYR